MVISYQPCLVAGFVTGWLYQIICFKGRLTPAKNCYITSGKSYIIHTFYASLPPCFIHLYVPELNKLETSVIQNMAKRKCVNDVTLVKSYVTDIGLNEPTFMVVKFHC